jgi:hypothetical protein
MGRLARELNVPVNELNRVVFHLTLAEATPRAAACSPNGTGEPREPLRLVR